MLPHHPRLWTPLFLLLTAVADATTLTHEFPENSDLLDGCRFSLGRQMYDLCPLMLEKETREVRGTAWVSDEGVGSSRVYSFTFGGVRYDRKCPEGTWVCMSETRGSENPASETVSYTPIAGRLRNQSPLVDEGVNAIASIFDDTHHPTPALNLFLIGAVHEDKRRYARIEFICDPESQSTEPSFISETLGVHSFTWTTRYGCPILNPNVSPKPKFAPHTLDEAPNDAPPNSDSDDEGEQDLLDPKVPREVPRRWVAFVLLSTGTLLITITLLLFSPHTRSLLSSHLKSIATRIPRPFQFQFRAGENRLVRWAQEDMALGELDGEVDVMVNGGGGDGEWDGEGVDEYIPLKSGKTRGGKRDYGSARGALFR
ncbi:hypothetical protein FPV67DRAFT_1781427 [Lyophyllum atratum]|nr:hypothetical protein FPV67DRAFT_1781427 [Lyophyllum atratum]